MAYFVASAHPKYQVSHISICNHKYRQIMPDNSLDPQISNIWLRVKSLPFPRYPKIAGFVDVYSPSHMVILDMTHPHMQHLSVTCWQPGAARPWSFWPWQQTDSLVRSVLPGRSETANTKKSWLRREKKKILMAVFKKTPLYQYISTNWLVGFWVSETDLRVSFQMVQPKITKKIKNPFIFDLPCNILQLDVHITTRLHTHSIHSPWVNTSPMPFPPGPWAVGSWRHSPAELRKDVLRSLEPSPPLRSCTWCYASTADWLEQCFSRVSEFVVLWKPQKVSGCIK